MKRVLSLGAGVQSTTVALLSKHGELPALDCAVFADTGWEPKAVYAHLDWLETQLPFRVHRVAARHKIQDNPYRNGDEAKLFVSLPMFTEGGGMLWRQCTKEYKIEPIRAQIRKILGLVRGERAGRTPRVIQWFGISRDEASRMRDSDVPWIIHHYPLVLDRPMTRNDCLVWLKTQGYPEPPRSACIGCPMHSDAEWRRLKDTSPNEFQQAVEFERQLQAKQAALGHRIKQVPYLHRSLMPIAQVDFSTPEDRGQLNWLNECGGHCGV